MDFGFQILCNRSTDEFDQQLIVCRLLNLFELFRFWNLLRPSSLADLESFKMIESHFRGLKFTTFVSMHWITQLLEGREAKMMLEDVGILKLPNGIHINQLVVNCWFGIRSGVPLSLQSLSSKKTTKIQQFTIRWINPPPKQKNKCKINTPLPPWLCNDRFLQVASWISPWTLHQVRLTTAQSTAIGIGL